MNTHLHGGKWSEAEEMYAAALIEAFKAGVLPASDIDEGTSLRKYLAKKLMCSPKRVSKKYEGTNYNGKQVYFKNRGVPGTIITAQEQLALLAKIQILEHKFLQSLAENKAPGGLAPRQPASSELELDRYTQLQMQALSRDQQQLTIGSLHSAAPATQHRTSLLAATPRASLVAQDPSLAQTLALARLQEQSSRSGIEGRLLDSLGGSSSFASATSSSLMPQIRPDHHEMTRMALAGGNQLALPSGGLSTSGLTAGIPLSNNSRLLSQVAAHQSSMIDATVEAARLQQLEQTLLRSQAQTHVGSNPLVRSTSASLQTSLHNAARIRSASLVDQQQQLLLDASILESYLSPSAAKTQVASLPAAAGARQLENAITQPLRSPPILALSFPTLAQRTSRLHGTSKTSNSTEEKKRPGQHSSLDETHPGEPPSKRWKPN